MSETRRVRYTIRIENSDGETLEAEVRSMEIDCPRGGTLERHYAVLKPNTTEAIAIWPRDLEAILHECALKDRKYEDIKSEYMSPMYDDDDPCVGGAGYFPEGSKQ